MSAKKKSKRRSAEKSDPSAEKPDQAEPKAPRPPFWTRDRAIELGVAALAGVLFFTSVATFDFWWQAWFAFVPVLWLIDRAPTGKRAMWNVWFCGLVTNAGGFYWIIGLLERFAHLPWILAALLFLLLAGYQALVYLMFGRVVWSLRRRYALPMTLLAPVVMVAFELIVPMVFPWYLAISQAWVIPVIQVADLAGPLGVSFLIMIVNGALYDVWQRRRAAWRPAAAAVAVLAAALVYGYVRIDQIDARRAAAPKIDVGVVQPNVSFDMKGANKPEYAAGQVRDLQACSAELEARGADLLVWTESSYPYWVSRRAERDFPTGHHARIREGFSVPLFMGAITFQRGDEYPYNSALMLDADDRFTARFDKIFLLMFGEYIPLLDTFPFIKKLMPKAAGHFARGKEVLTFPYRRPVDPPDAPPWRLGPLICYEDIIPAFGRNLADYHPHLLVNITNDAWFGATSEPWEHLQLSVFRSVELRTDMVRAVNTGVSAWIDANGRVYHKTYSIDPASQPLPPGRTTCGVTPGSLADAEIAPMVLMEGGHTVYAAVGDLFGFLNLGVTAVLWILWPMWRRRRPGSA